MEKIRLVLPDAEARKMNGFLKSQVQTYLLSKMTKETFFNARDNFGAVIVCKDKELVCRSLGIPLDTDGIVEGLTITEYAELKSKSRQAIHKAAGNGKLQMLNVGPLAVITEKD